MRPFSFALNNSDQSGYTNSNTSEGLQMSCQVWDKDGNIHHITIEDFEASVPAGLYLTHDPKSEQAEPVKRTRKPKAVADEKQD